MGATREEVIKNISDGIKFHLQGMTEEGLEIPIPNAEAENLLLEYDLI